MKFKSLTGKVVEVIPTGKSFKTITTYPATKRVPEEVIVKKHKTWAGVEKRIDGMEVIEA